MNNVYSIPIRNEVRGKRGTNLDIANRLLRDISVALQGLASEGKASLIDLRQIPHMTAETYQHLRDELGRGEVSATVAADFKVEITETAVPGVWWVAHRDADGETVTEIIEITQVPSILRASRGEIRAGAMRLAAQVADAARVKGDAVSIAQQERRPEAAMEVEG